MNLRGGRPPRPDAWPDAHARARVRAAERLEGPLDPAEASWLDDHVATCRACRDVAAAYAAQRSELRTLAARQPVPPRDLWARTAAAIEHEATFRDRSAGRRRPRSLLAPYALLSAALVVAVVVGTLTSSQRPGGDGATASSLPGTTSAAATAGHGTPNPGVTPMPVPHDTVEWVTQDSNGNYEISSTRIEQVCPDAASPCPTTAPTEKRRVDLNGTAKSVIGSPDGDQVVVVGNGGSAQTDNVSVHSLASPAATSASPPPSSEAPSSPATTPSATPSATARATTSSTPAPSSPSQSPAPPPSATPSVVPSVEISASPTSPGTVEIARDVIVVGQSASYSPSGTWFAFTARPADGSTGPDIYLWRVAGGAEAHPVTQDHRSELGGWSGDVIVGSTAVDTPNGTLPTTFVIDAQSGKQTMRPEVGPAWRPTVDPSSRQAVYWTGTLRPTLDGPGFAPDAGRLVVGAWSGADGTAGASPSPSASAAGSGSTTSGGSESASAAASGGADAAASSDPSAAASLDQARTRNETTIVAGHISDWDARWDETGTRLAVWIADDTDPSVGRLSVYAVDSFSGQIDLKKPLVDGRLAKAGFAIGKGRIVWAEPAKSGSGEGRIFVFAWTDQGTGEVEGVPGKVIVIR